MSELRETDLPALYQSADKLAQAGQTRAKVFIGSELLMLILAGASGVTTWRLGPAQIDVLATVGAVAFLAALGITTARITRKPENDWYIGRAAAESVRTLAWCYTVGGDPFPITPTQSQSDASERFLERLREILDELDDVELAITSVEAHEISPAMRAKRAEGLDDRRATYLRARISDQLGWYQRRSLRHRRAANRWVAVAVIATVLGLIAAVLKAIGVYDTDILGVAASCATSAIGWSQTSQHRTLVSSYALAARELSLIRDQVIQVAPDDWPLFVSDAEDAISREHTMWLARHGHPGMPRRR